MKSPDRALHRTSPIAEFGGIEQIMNAQSIGGIWTYPSVAFPGHDDFMSIDEERGRIIVFVVFSVDPLQRSPMRFRYRPESPNSITARLRATDSWRVHEFRLEDDRMLWTYGGGNHPWRRLPSHECPDWLDPRLETENSKMDAADNCA